MAQSLLRPEESRPCRPIAALGPDKVPPTTASPTIRRRVGQAVPKRSVRDMVSVTGGAAAVWSEGPGARHLSVKAELLEAPVPSAVLGEQGARGRPCLPGLWEVRPHLFPQNAIEMENVDSLPKSTGVFSAKFNNRKTNSDPGDFTRVSYEHAVSVGATRRGTGRSPLARFWKGLRAHPWASPEGPLGAGH